MMNKKANNMGSWTEGIIIMMLFLVGATILIADFNTNTGTNSSLGISSSAESSLADFNELADSSKTNIDEGQTSLTSFGLTLLSSWSLAKGILGILWDTLTGQWINYIILNLLQIANPMGGILVAVFKTLFLISLVLAIIKLFFKTPA